MDKCCRNCNIKNSKFCPLHDDFYWNWDKNYCSKFEPIAKDNETGLEKINIALEKILDKLNEISENK